MSCIDARIIRYMAEQEFHELILQIKCTDTLTSYIVFYDGVIDQSFSVL